MITDKVGGSSAKPQVSKQSKEKRLKHKVSGYESQSKRRSIAGCRLLLRTLRGDTCKPCSSLNFFQIFLLQLLLKLHTWLTIFHVKSFFYSSCIKFWIIRGGSREGTQGGLPPPLFFWPNWKKDSLLVARKRAAKYIFILKYYIKTHLLSCPWNIVWSL